MTITPIFLILSILAFINGWLGALVFRRNRQRPANRIFLVLSLAMASWILTSALADVLTDERMALFAAQLAIVGPFIFSTFLLFFSHAFPARQPMSRQLRAAAWVLLLIALLAVPTRLNIERFKLEDWGADYEPGYLYTFLFIHLVVFVSLAVRRFRKARRTLSGQARAQVRWALAGIVAVIALGLVTNLLLPLIGYARASVFGPAASIFFVGFTTYAIVRHHLLDIRITLKKTFVQVAVSLSILIVMLAVLSIIGALLHRPLSDIPFVALGSVAFLFVSLFISPLSRRFERLANRYFFTSLSNYQKTLEDLARQLTSVIELGKVIDLIVQTIVRTMGLDRAGVLLLAPEKNANRYVVAKVIGFNEQNGISLVRDNFLVQWLVQHGEPVVVEDLTWRIEETVSPAERSQLNRLKMNMMKIEASLVLPLLSQGTLTGMIVLGSKATGESYTSEDLRLLTSIANQASVAIENARLYQQVRDFNRTLRQKVEQQTREIRDKNRALEELLGMKDEFLHVASHQLKTPISITRGYLSMILDGSIKGEKKVHDALQKAMAGIDRLNDTTKDFLDASDLEGKQPRLDRKDLDIMQLLRQLCADREPLARKKAIALRLVPPKEPLPPILADASRLADAIANLIDNAIFYTLKGSVTVSAVPSASPHEIVIAIQDTGIGISEADSHRLFHKFSRGKQAILTKPDGSGLGLYIAKKLIEAHGGTITLTSQVGIGSVFTVHLPLATD